MSTVDIETKLSRFSVSNTKVPSSGIETFEFVFQFDSQLFYLYNIFFNFRYLHGLLALSRPWKVQTCTEQLYSTAWFTTKDDTAQYTSTLRKAVQYGKQYNTGAGTVQ